MITFKQFLSEDRGDLPVSHAALTDELPLMDFIEKIHKKIAKSIPSSVTINVRELADAGKLESTQLEIDDDDPSDDPVFPELELPVIFESGGVGYIIDGHHRLNRAYRQHGEQEVFWFK